MDYIEIIKEKTIRIDDIKEINHLFESKNKFYSYINPFVYLTLKDNKDLIASLDGIYLDGFMMVLIFRLMGVKTIRLSCDMTSVFKHLFLYASTERKTIYAIGSTQDNIEKSIQNIKNSFPNLIVLNYRNGFFTDRSEIEKECENINLTNPDFLLVGMGTPFQEKFINDVKVSGYKGVTFTCGGFFHQTIGKLNYYPKYIDSLNLRWLYRMFDEKRVFYRTIKYYPLFVLSFTRDLIKLKLK